MKYGAVYCLYDDHEYLEISLFPISMYLDEVLFLISDIPWNGSKSNNIETILKIKKLCEENPKFELIQGHWTNEIDQRNFGLSVLLKSKIDYAFIIDTDEVYSEQCFLNIQKFIEANPRFDAFHVEWNTYWKKDYYKICPRESYQPLIAVRIGHFQFTIIRGGTTAVIHTADGFIKSDGPYNAILIPSQIAICHHLSYARTDGYMKRKLETNSHHNEFISDWYEKIWAKWFPQMRNLHPVTPQQYAIASRTDFIEFPDQLKTFIKAEKLSYRPCSIIILNWNSCGLLKRCIELIQTNTRHPYELIIIDNGSTKDDSVSFIENLSCRKLLNSQNLGFPAGVNQALRVASAGNDVCLLNVDAEVQEGWLEKLYETLLNNPFCGVVGPLGNEAENRYQAAGSVFQDTVVPNVHGFCMLIMNEVLSKIGGLDERYSPGGVEDIDYCMRSRLAGYTVMISSQSLVKHQAHQVYGLNGVDSNQRYRIDQDNWGKYYQKFYGMFLDYGQVYDYFSVDLLAKKTGLII